MIQRETCTTIGCGAAALPLSTPARCRLHIESIEDWYDDFRRRLGEMPLGVDERHSEVAVVLQEIRTLVYIEPVASEFYTAWYRRIEPDGERSFSIGNVAVFCLMAAASGAIGNFAYDAIKAVLRRLGKDTETHFEAMVTLSKYDEIRQRLHGDRLASLEISEEVTVSIRRRYLMLSDEGKPNERSQLPPEER